MTPDLPTWRNHSVSRRTILQISGVAAVAVGGAMLTERPASAATANSLFAGGPGSTKALGRTSMPSVTGTFRVSFDYLYPAGSMSGFYVFSSFDNTVYKDPRIWQDGDRLTIATSAGTFSVDQQLAADAWHRFVLDFVPGHVTVYVDGVRQTSGTTTRFAIAAGTALDYFGYLGDLSTAGYGGTAYWDNLLVESGGTTTFSRNFDDGAPLNWTQTSVAGTGVFGLANPARNAEVAALATAELVAPTAAAAGQPFTVRVAGAATGGRGVLLEQSSVTLTAQPSGVTLTPEGGGYFSVTAPATGTVTLSATVNQGGVSLTDTATVSLVEGSAPKSVTVSAPLATTFVGDTMALQHQVVAMDGTSVDPATLIWTHTSSAPAVATVDANGLLTALTPGTVTITATGAGGGAQVSDTVEVTVAALTTAKTRASYWTTERRAVAAANIAAYGWAAAQRDSAVAIADAFVAKGYRKIWDTVTSQQIPRSYAFSSVEQDGCLNCGIAVHAYGQYPYLADVVNKPWKITCPNPACNFDFPTNDFAAYYAGGLDDNGFFDPAKAKRHNDKLIADGGTGNLVNVGHPEKGEGWGVDDGAGTKLANGVRYTPIAYYNHWKLWHTGELAQAIVALREAYLYTGDVKYANVGVVLLDRVADVYPGLNLDEWTYPNGYLNSNGNTSRGKAVGSIWETGLIREYILAYDAFYPALADGSSSPVSAEALNFLDEASALMDKKNVKRIRRNIEDGILRTILPAVKRGEIRGNNGMHQATLAIAAVVMDHLPETKEWLEFNFATGTVSGTEVAGGNLGSIFVNDVDRDGNGTEAAPGYNSLWLGQFTNVADYLDGYVLAGLPDYGLYSNPKYLKMFDGIYPMTMLGGYTPTIGDTGATGNRIMSVGAATMIKAFAKTGREEYAQVAHWLNGRSTIGIKQGIFDADPEKIAADIQAVVDSRGEWQEPSRMLTGYGFAALRDGVPPAKAPVSGFQKSFSDLTVKAQTQPTKYFDTNGTTQFEAANVGDSVTFEFVLAAPLQGNLLLDVFQASSYGVYSVKLDAAVIAAEVSFGGAGIGSRDLGPVTLAAGAHQLAFTLVKAEPGPKCGLRVLQIGEPQTGPIDVGTHRGSWLYFGRNGGHGHLDTNNINYYAHGMDLLPDMGYPRYANSIDMHRRSLVINTISHNTVIVDDKGQNSVIVGNPQLFDGGAAVQVVEVDAPKAYSQVSRYRRTLAQVRIDDENSYLVDFFRVQGGTKHLYSFHSMDASSVTVEGAALVPQKNAAGAYVGTYAGPNVAYNDTINDPTGFSYFYNVDRAAGSFGTIAATWSNLKDTWGVRGPVDAVTDVNLRLTLLGSHSDVALATCEPPQNKPGNPKQLRYLLAKSPATGGSSVFTGVIESYRGSRIVQQVAAVAVTTAAGAAVSDQDVRAVKVTLPGGRVDTVVHAIDPSKVYLVDGRRFQGSFGVLTTQTGQPDRVHLVNGTAYGPTVFGALAALTGTVSAFTKELSSTNTLTLSLTAEEAFQVDPADLVGRYVHVADDGVRNAVYRIAAVNSWSSTSAVFSLDNVTPIRSYVDVNDPSKGYVYDLAVGRAARIPLRVTEPTDGAARTAELLGYFAAQLQRPNGSQLKVLAERAGAHQKAGKLAEALGVARDLRGQLDNAPIASQLTPAARAMLIAVLDGWIRQLGG